MKKTIIKTGAISFFATSFNGSRPIAHKCKHLELLSGILGDGKSDLWIVEKSSDYHFEQVVDALKMKNQNILILGAVVENESPQQACKRLKAYLSQNNSL